WRGRGQFQPTRLESERSILRRTTIREMPVEQEDNRAWTTGLRRPARPMTRQPRREGSFRTDTLEMSILDDLIERRKFFPRVREHLPVELRALLWAIRMGRPSVAEQRSIRCLSVGLSLLV